MANRDYSSVSTALNTLLESTVTSQINRAVVAAQLVGVQPADGKNVSWDVKLGTATPTTAGIADGADVSVYNADTKIPAVLSFAEYHDAFAITGKARAAAEVAGPAGMQNLFVEEASDSIERLASVIGTDFWTGDGTYMLGMYGGSTLQSGAPLGIAGTYAGIDRSTYPQWKANNVAAGGQGLSFKLMRSLAQKIYTASGEKADLIFMDPVQFNAYAELFGPQRRFVDEVRTASGASIKLSGGHSVLEFDGTSVIEDVLHPASAVTFLNSRHVRIRQLLQNATADGTGMNMVQIGGSPEAQLGAGRIKMAAFLRKLAVTGNKDNYAFYVITQAQLRRPNTCGTITGLPASY